MPYDYVCTCCGQTHTSSRPKNDPDLEAERKKLWPLLSDEEQAQVCEPCFIKIMDHGEPEKYRYLPYIKKH